MAACTTTPNILVDVTRTDSTDGSLVMCPVGDQPIANTPPCQFTTLFGTSTATARNFEIFVDDSEAAVEAFLDILSVPPICIELGVTVGAEVKISYVLGEMTATCDACTTISNIPTACNQ